MTAPAADPTPDKPEAPAERAAGRLAWIAGAACVACCAVPGMVAAGLLGGGALTVAAWLPELAIALAATAILVFGWSRWRAKNLSSHGCKAGACSCADSRRGADLPTPSVRPRP